MRLLSRCVDVDKAEALCDDLHVRVVHEALEVGDVCNTGGEAVLSSTSNDVMSNEHTSSVAIRITINPMFLLMTGKMNRIDLGERQIILQNAKKETKGNREHSTILTKYLGSCHTVRILTQNRSTTENKNCFKGNKKT